MTINMKLSICPHKFVVNRFNVCLGKYALWHLIMALDCGIIFRHTCILNMPRFVKFAIHGTGSTLSNCCSFSLYFLEDFSLCYLSKTLFNMCFCPKYRPVHDVKILRTSVKD